MNAKNLAWIIARNKITIYKNKNIGKIVKVKTWPQPNGRFEFVRDYLLFDENRIYMYLSRCCYMNSRFDEQSQKFIEESHVCGVELDTEWWYDKDASQMPKIKQDYYKFDEMR